MGYLVDFEQAIANHDAPKIIRLWEEYTSSDEEVDAEDFLAILEAVKASELSDYIGRHVERSLSLWEKVTDEAMKDEILRLIIDLQVSGSDHLYNLTLSHLENKFGNEEDFAKKTRIIGLRGTKGDFQGIISHYLLLNHIKKGNFVFHTGGWGVGEILDVSMLREQLNLEFDYVPGIKEISFKVAFDNLIPLSKEHFLSRRFGAPDDLEAEGKKDPVKLIKLLLKDTGPKTAAEIKDELCELVIPEANWNRWWQTARTKIKKDTQIESPSSLKKPFLLLKDEVSHEERLQKALEKGPDADVLIQMVYSFLKDFSETLKNVSFKESLIGKLKELLSFQEITASQELQIHFFLQDLTGDKKYEPIIELLKKAESIETIVTDISIQAYKKRALVEVKKHRSDWQKLFLSLLFIVEHNPLRDYILGALIGSEIEETLLERLRELCSFPQKHPEVLVWYFQKAMNNPSLPFGNTAGKARLFEAFLTLLCTLEQVGDRRELIKKMHNILTTGRYQIVRDVLKDASLADVQEFLLLVTKCYSLSDHDIKIFHSLAEVVHPSLAKKRPVNESPEEVIVWTTQEGFATLQKKIEHIGTVETVDNAKEIEIARAHGDLRENAEFKAALERRDRLQSELKFLSDQLNMCRVLTEGDIDTSQVSVGTAVTCKTKDGKSVTYTLLGPWDANPEENILSFQSQIAQNLIGLKKGDAVELQGKKLTITEIKSAL